MIAVRPKLQEVARLSLGAPSSRSPPALASRPAPALLSASVPSLARLAVVPLLLKVMKRTGEKIS